MSAAFLYPPATMATRKKTTAVAKTATTSTDLATLDYGQHAGQGWEDVNADDLSIPFINLLQALSPEVNAEEGDVEFVEGAKAGAFVNTVTRELHEDVSFVPCHLDHCFVEWVPRKEGGGFVARHEIDSDVVRDAKARSEDGIRLTVPVEGQKIPNDLLNTYYLYCLILDEDGEQATGMAVISFNITKVKPFKQFLTRLRTIRGGAKIPLFAHRARMSSARTKNAAGESYYIPTFAPAVGSTYQDSLLLPTNEAHADILAQASEFAEQVRSGAAKPAEEKPQGSGKADVEDDAF